MNYCPNCGTPVESHWKVCANCGHRLSREQISILPQKEPETQVETVEFQQYFRIEMPYVAV